MVATHASNSQLPSLRLTSCPYREGWRSDLTIAIQEPGLLLSAHLGPWKHGGGRPSSRPWRWSPASVQKLPWPVLSSTTFASNMVILWRNQSSNLRTNLVLHHSRSARGAGPRWGAGWVHKFQHLRMFSCHWFITIKLHVNVNTFFNVSHLLTFIYVVRQTTIHVQHVALTCIFVFVISVMH